MGAKVYVIGLGMGNPDTLTHAAREALDGSELIIGSPRLVEALHGLGKPVLALVRAADIAEALHTTEAAVASVVMSGDVGFYSGATGLYPLIEDLDVEVVPGISSLAYLCAKLRTTWQDAYVVSAHGRAHNAVGAIQSHPKTFVLVGGAYRAEDLCSELVDRGLGELQVSVGERLSYPDERITCGSAASLAGGTFDPLSVVLVCNDCPIERVAGGPLVSDGAFVRGEVPMTKEEVRALAICKLRIRPADTVWDVGSGTGSVSVEAARAACEGQVIAIERAVRAVELTEANRARFHLPNIRVVAGEAPGVLAGLPTPDRVFVGGSSGCLTDILRVAIGANPAVRLCCTAITLETLAECLSAITTLGLREVEIVQLTVAKSRELGSRHLMMGGNPVYLISADGPGVCEGGVPCA